MASIRERERRARSNYKWYQQSDMRSLADAYGRYSQAKANAWRYCEDLCERYNGTNLKVISNNCHKFTAGFEFMCPSTGVVMFMYITKDYDTIVEVA